MLVPLRRLEVVDHDRDEQVDDHEDGEHHEAHVVHPRPTGRRERCVHEIDPAFEGQNLEQREPGAGQRSPVGRIDTCKEVHAHDRVDIEDETEQHDDVGERRDRPQHRSHDEAQLRQCRHDPQRAKQPREPGHRGERTRRREEREGDDREVEDVPAVEEETVDARAEREQAHRDLDDEDRLHGNVQDVEDVAVPVPQRRIGLHADQDGVRDNDRERPMLEPAARCGPAAEMDHAITLTSRAGDGQAPRRRPVWTMTSSALQEARRVDPHIVR